MDNEIKRELILEHFNNPVNKGLVDDPSYIKESKSNASCIDHFTIELKLEDDIVKDIRFDGEACAIATSSLSIAISKLIGKTKEEAVEVVEKTVLTVCHQAKADKRRNLRLLITVCIISVIIFCMLCVSIFLGIAQSLKGESYAVLTNDLSCLTYYGERYVPLDMNGYSCRLGEEIVDEIKLDGGSILDKLLSEYALQSVQGAPDNDLVYLRSEHDIDFYVKETKIGYYQKLLNDLFF